MEADEPLLTGYLIGVLGGAHFGGDGRQPQVTLRVHLRRAATLELIDRRFPGGALYGPYHHGGRSYMQWIARGAFLRARLAPLVRRHRFLLDAHTAARFDAMCERYGIGAGDVGRAGPAP